MKCHICKEEKVVLIECPLGVEYCLECYENAMCDYSDETRECHLTCGAEIIRRKNAES